MLVCCSSNGATRGLLGKEGHVRDIRPEASEVGLIPLVVISMSSALLVASAGNKEKAQLVALLK